MEPPYRLPLRIQPIPAGFVILDAGGARIAYVYAEPEESRRGVAGLLSPEDAVKVAQRIARALTDAAE